MLSHAQAVEVAKRLNPAAGRTLWFSHDGSLLGAVEEQRGLAALRGEVYACRRAEEDDLVEVARVRAEELEAGTEPAFGEPW